MSTTISSSDLFREECAPIWTALHQHPFITELAEGTLPLDKFRFFLEQDVFYLEEYAPVPGDGRREVAHRDASSGTSPST